MNSSNTIGNTSKNQIIISKNDIPRLKKDFGFFEAFIDRNFSNSDQYFDKNGNYILKKELFPEEMVHYDSNSDEEYVIKRNDMWKAIPKALNDYHVPNKILGDFLANYLIFKTHKNSLFNPTVPEQEAITSPNRVFFPGPSKSELKRRRRTQRQINNLRRDLGEDSNNNNAYKPFFYRRLTNQNLLENLGREKRAEEVFKLKEKLRQQKKQNVENLAEEIQKIFENQFAAPTPASAMLLAQIANANHPKYGNKPGVLPGVLQTRRRQKRKEKRGTQKRAKQRSFKRGPVTNNENFNAFEEFQGFENNEN